MDMSMGKLQEFVMDREAWHAAVYGITKLRDWTKLNHMIKQFHSWEYIKQ